MSLSSTAPASSRRLARRILVLAGAATLAFGSIAVSTVDAGNTSHSGHSSHVSKRPVHRHHHPRHHRPKHHKPKHHRLVDLQLLAFNDYHGYVQGDARRHDRRGAGRRRRVPVVQARASSGPATRTA